MTEYNELENEREHKDPPVPKSNIDGFIALLIVLALLYLLIRYLIKN